MKGRLDRRWPEIKFPIRVQPAQEGEAGHKHIVWYITQMGRRDLTAHPEITDWEWNKAPEVTP